MDSARTQAQRRGWRQSVLAVVTMLGAVAIALCLGEALLHLFGVTPKIHVVFRENITPSDNPVLEYELNPGSHDGWSIISSLGLRDRELATNKPAGVFRIVVIGDSVTYGLDRPRDRAYPKRLEAMLNRHAPMSAPLFEVINLGVPGYHITQVVESLRVKGLPFQPDLVIYGYVLNDPQGISLESESLKNLRAQADRAADTSLLRGPARLISTTRLFRLAWQLSLDPPLPPRARVPSFDAFSTHTLDSHLRSLHHAGESQERWRSGLARLARMTRREGNIPCLVAIFPVDGAGGFEAYTLTDLHELVAAEATRCGLDTLDLLDAFRSAARTSPSPLYRDLLHPNDKGHRVAAGALLRHLVASTIPAFDGFLLDSVALPARSDRFADAPPPE